MMAFIASGHYINLDHFIEMGIEPTETSEWIIYGVDITGKKRYFGQYQAMDDVTAKAVAEKALSMIIREAEGE